MLRIIILIWVLFSAIGFYYKAKSTQNSEKEQNYKKVYEFYKNSAEQGNSEAQYHLGDIYYKGQGVTQDYKKAKEWYEKSAVQGSPKAQYNLGLMYEQGHGVRQNYYLALEYFGDSCDNGLQKGCEIYAFIKKYKLDKGY